ncbi:MoaD/ThiS family protein [Acidithiobacillus montserratensis]|uniref:MoaD/ThiS family protein n=1 Tax=Acidithiobacillus montserratensis TaxID=2729135 RepID=A0ACD5HBX1_9PROT|nr:MoaD/ThiS family protein [Acidithiobacillus montserratensis]MBN2678903.1 MoaD/ThiS family protein [Acidithiobacillaceae bacterium]MBU2746647.1 MoaD/ThiS family protein [Acidithiobacillus montserratensis]
MIHVRFFASVRERVGMAEMQLPCPLGGFSVEEVLTMVEGQAGTELRDVHLLASLNQQHVPFTTPVHDEDEVAFFPPVTGG